MSFENVEKVVQVRDQNSANEQLAAGWSLLAVVPGFDNGCAYTSFVLGKPATVSSVNSDLPLANDAAVAAIRFALDDDGMQFLQLWNQGDFDVIRREWPEAPDEVFIGAYPLHKPSK